MSNSDAKGLMLNLASVDPEHEDAFNRWYQKEHIADVQKRFPEITRVRRYRASDGQEPKYLVVYEYDTKTEADLQALASADHPMRKELWKIYDDAVGKFAKRSRRTFRQVFP